MSWMTRPKNARLQHAVHALGDCLVPSLPTLLTAAAKWVWTEGEGVVRYDRKPTP